MEKKKNSKHYIIPPSYFKALGVKPVPVVKPETVVEKQILKEEVSEQVKIEESKLVKAEEPLPEFNLNRPSPRTSGLSLKSIKAKKEHQIKQMEVVIDEENLPKEEFTEDMFMEAWNDYIKSLHESGKKIMASMLEMNQPTIDGTTIGLEFPNETLKLELEKSQFPLMEFLRKKLQNFDLKLDITVNEEASKQYVFTTREKYEKMKEKNPNIELLKKTFGLDIN